jgi:hypothetical protein
MELNELVGVGVIIGNWQCPFPHKKEEWPDCTNDFVGVGGTLGESLESGKQTNTNKARGGGRKITSVPKPKDDPASSVYNQATPIKLGGVAKHLPLTCAAHHLIPAQASLRESRLVKYLYKGSATFKASGKKGATESKGGGKLEANVGYDVNGSQNGVWLPGPYALRKKKKSKAPAPGGGVKKLRGMRRTVTVPVGPPADFIDDDEEEDFPTSGLDESDEPEGTTIVQEREVTYYLLYTISAMRKLARQYHDAHGDYSTFVLKCLNTIATELRLLAYKGACDECPKREPKDKLPPPYRLVARLNSVAARFRNLLLGSPSGWAPNVWTSAMSVEFGKRVHMDIQLADIEAPPPKK